MSEGEKIGGKAYDLNAYLARGPAEIANGLYPESQIPVRDGVYWARDHGDIQQAEPSRETQVPEIEHKEPELER